MAKKIKLSRWLMKIAAEKTRKYGKQRCSNVLEAAGEALYTGVKNNMKMSP
ncbi:MULTISPECIES: hypothetical protein [Acinetobacter]|uniref:hypothetical protein n=1 Tax=Acinetobacter TaxID=469 RepID=UPI001443F957|nr:MULTISPECIES: hypothetical protein [Acinetobacter]